MSSCPTTHCLTSNLSSLAGTSTLLRALQLTLACLTPLQTMNLKLSQHGRPQVHFMPASLSTLKVYPTSLALLQNVREMLSRHVESVLQCFAKRTGLRCCRQ